MDFSDKKKILSIGTIVYVVAAILTMLFVRWFPTQGPLWFIIFFIISAVLSPISRLYLRLMC